MTATRSASTRQPDKKPLTLVLLAAGAGSRYGGVKQLEPFGPSGETIMEYSIYDACLAGFEEVVLVIRSDLEEVFRDSLDKHAGRRIPIRFVHQRLDDLPPAFTAPAGRTRPWGTAQAVLAAAGAVGGSFVVANADDLYGPSALASLAEFSRRLHGDEMPTYALVGYRLGDTLSESGAVSRGICECTSDGLLTNIVEMTRIEKHGDDGRVVDQAGNTRLIAGDTLVSMNLLGFDVSFFQPLREGFSRFLGRHGRTLDHEYYLPQAVQEVVHERRAGVKVLPSRDKWYGVTHPQDKAAVEAAFRELTAGGTYPQPLWRPS